MKVGDSVMCPTTIDIVLIFAAGGDEVLNDDLTTYGADITIHQEASTWFGVWFRFFNTEIPAHIDGASQKWRDVWCNDGLVWKMIWIFLKSWEKNWEKNWKIVHCRK